MENLVAKISLKNLVRFLQLCIYTVYIYIHAQSCSMHILRASKSNVHDILKTESGYSPSPTSKLYDKTKGHHLKLLQFTLKYKAKSNTKTHGAIHHDPPVYPYVPGGRNATDAGLSWEFWWNMCCVAVTAKPKTERAAVVWRMLA